MRPDRPAETFEHGQTVAKVAHTYTLCRAFPARGKGQVRGQPKSETVTLILHSRVRVLYLPYYPSDESSRVIYDNRLELATATADQRKLPAAAAPAECLQ
jgi:hypothetical protein